MAQAGEVCETTKNSQELEHEFFFNIFKLFDIVKGTSYESRINDLLNL